MSSCPPTCALRIFQAAKESESSLLCTAYLHPARDWVSHANVRECAAPFAVQQRCCCTLYGTALCHLPVNPLWTSCPACSITATEAMADRLVNSPQARWKSPPHSFKLEKDGSQAVLLLRVCFCTMFPFTSVQSDGKVGGKLVRCEPVDEASQSLQARHENFFFFFLWAVTAQAGWQQSDLHPSLSFQQPLVHPHHWSLPAINKCKLMSGLCFFPCLHSAKGHTWSGTSELVLNLRKCCQGWAWFSNSFVPLQGSGTNLLPCSLCCPSDFTLMSASSVIQHWFAAQRGTTSV